MGITFVNILGLIFLAVILIGGTIIKSVTGKKVNDREGFRGVTTERDEHNIGKIFTFVDR